MNKEDTPDYWHKLGRLYHEQGNAKAAEKAYLKALQIDDKLLRTINNLALLYLRAGRQKEAMGLIAKGLNHAQKQWADEKKDSLAEEWALILNSRCQLALDNDRFDEARKWSKLVLKLQPMGTGLSNLSVALAGMNRYEEAGRGQQLGLKRHRMIGPIHTWIGKKLTTPYSSTQLHTEICNLASSLLRNNPLRLDAWVLMTARLGMEPKVWEGSILPWEKLWDGRYIDHLVIWDEQGYGDAMQCFRWIQEACKRADRVTLLLRESLLELVKQRLSLPKYCDIKLQEASGFPKDINAQHCPMMALPVALSRANAKHITIKSRAKARTVLKSNWTQKKKDRKNTETQKKKVGLVWAAGPKADRDAERSSRLRCIPGELLIERAFQWADSYNLELLSLQLGSASEVASKWVEDGRVMQLHADGDWLSTAKLVEKLDLVVSVDTAMVHLAGNLGVPCILLLNYLYDWRWLNNGKLIPWYPGLQVLRNEEEACWDDLLLQLDSLIGEFFK